MSKLDCNWVCWQIQLKDTYVNNTTLVFHSVSSHFSRILFGLKSAPNTFQCALYIIISPYTCKTCLVYLYYITAFSKDTDYHLQHVYQVLSALDRSNVTIKFKN